MDEELEGIELGTVDLENTDVIELPDVEEQQEEQEQEVKENVDVNKQLDNEKQSLKRGINQERNLRKAAERKNKELEKRIQALEEASKKPQKTTIEELMEQGVEEGIAKSIANAIDKKQENNSNLAEQLEAIKFEKNLMEKSKEEGFEDILDYSEEIKEFVDKGLTLEQSYYAVTYDKSTTKNTKSEIERKVEARLQNNQARKQILGNYNSNTGAATNSTTKIKATPEERAIASMAGLSVEEYIAMRDMGSMKDYRKYNATKKK